MSFCITIAIYTGFRVHPQVINQREPHVARHELLTPKKSHRTDGFFAIVPQSLVCSLPFTVLKNLNLSVESTYLEQVPHVEGHMDCIFELEHRFWEVANAQFINWLLNENSRGESLHDGIGNGADVGGVGGFADGLLDSLNSGSSPVPP